MNEQEMYYMAEADKCMATLLEWNAKNSALAYSGPGTAWNAMELAASKCLELAGFDLQQIAELLDMFYDCNEKFAYCAKYLEFI